MFHKITVQLLSVALGLSWAVPSFSANASNTSVMAVPNSAALPKVIVVKTLQDKAGHDVSAEVFGLNLSQKVVNDKTAEQVALQLDKRNGVAVEPDKSEAMPASVAKATNADRQSNAIRARWNWYDNRGTYGVYGYGYRGYYGTYRGYGNYGYYYGGYSYPYSYYPYSYYQYPYRYSYYYNPYYYYP